MSNPYAPQLPADRLWLERAVLIGDSLSQIAFGVSLVIFLQTISTLLQNYKRTRLRLDGILLVYTFTIFALGTTFIGMNTRSLQLMFIDNREFPGGPTAYSLSQYSSPITVIPNACSIVAGWLADGFLLYRCIVIFHLKLYILALPILMYLGSLSMGAIFLFQISRPTANFWTETSVNFGVPYFSLSTALNILLTLLIAARLLSYRAALRRAFGAQHAHSVPYAGIAAMMVESSLLYAVSSLLFIAPYGAKSHVSNIFLPVLSQVQIIAPMLIIYRVAKRVAWDSKTGTAPLTSIDFHSRRPRARSTTTTGRTHSHSSDDDEAEAGGVRVSVGLEPKARGKGGVGEGADEKARGGGETVSSERPSTGTVGGRERDAGV